MKGLSTELDVSNRGGHNIDQPITLQRESGNIQVLGVSQLLEKCDPGARIQIYADAGMGKTTLLRQIAVSWIEEKVTDKYELVFLVPMRRLGRFSLVDVICKDLELHPGPTIELNSDDVLILLDSYEELPHDVKGSVKTEIEALITGKRYPKCTVIVTSRHGSELTQLRAWGTVPAYTAHLHDLPEEEVRDKIHHQFPDQGDEVLLVLKNFSAITLLQKPMNLALFLYIASMQESQGELSKTQTELFNQVLQHVMLAYARKMKYKEFAPKSGPYFKNKGIPFEVKAVFKEISKKCYVEMKKTHIELHIQDGETPSTQDLISFGLFTKGPVQNSVVLPHRLFQEYFVALYLVEDTDAWEAVLADIKKKLGYTELLLRDAVGLLENVIVFLVGLSNDIAKQVGNLFVIKTRNCCCHKLSPRRHRCLEVHGPGRDPDNCTYRYPHQSELQYYVNVLHECSSHTRSVLVTALLDNLDTKTPGSIPDQVQDSDFASLSLFSYLDRTQRAEFFEKVYMDSTGRSTMKSSKKLYIVDDRYVPALVYLDNYFIHADLLYIIDMDLPVDMLSQNMTSVRHLKIDRCTLCVDVPDYLSNLIPLTEPPLLCKIVDTMRKYRENRHMLQGTVLERVQLRGVKGLGHLGEYGPVTSRQCQLEARLCDEVKISGLQKSFPEVSDLKLEDTRLQCDTGELTTVRTLQLVSRGKKDVYSISQLRASFPGLTKVELGVTTAYEMPEDLKWLATVATVFELGLIPLHMEREHMPDYHHQPLILQGRLESLSQRFVFQTFEDLVSLIVCGCGQRWFDVRYTGFLAKRNNTLSELKLVNCRGIDVDLLICICSQYQQLKNLTVTKSNLLLCDTRPDSISLRSLLFPESYKLSLLRLESCEGNIDLAILLRYLYLKSLLVDECNLLLDGRLSLRNWSTLEQLSLWNSSACKTSGQRLRLGEAKHLISIQCPLANVDIWKVS